MIATMNSGDSEAKGANHWTRMNCSIPHWWPTSSRPSANGSAEMKITNPEKKKKSRVTAIRCGRGQSAIATIGPSISGSS